jgi:tetratricopeptide (TPR) repeat protein
MKGFNIYLVLLLAVVMASCSTSKYVARSEKEISALNTQYYKLFTDATKHALFGNNKAAVAMYNACINQFPDRAAPYYQLSSIYLRENDVETARAFARKAECLDSSNIWYKAHLANIYQYENNYDSAALLYEDILRVNDDVETKYNLALLYSQIGKNQKALSLLDEIENEYKGNRRIFLMKHNIYHNMAEYDSAIFELESLIKYFPDDFSNYGILAEYLGEVGRNNYAKSVYRDLLKQDSLNGLAMLSYADFYLKLNKPDSAFVFYTKAVCCSDLDFEGKISVIVNFIGNKMVLEKFTERILKLVDTLRVYSDDYRVFASYTDIYINLQQYEKAVPYFDSSLYQEKNNLLLWEQAVLVNNYLGNNAKVVSLAGEALNYFPEQGNLLVIMAYSERELGNTGKAKSDIGKALELNLDDDLRIQSYNLLAEIFRSEDLHEKSDSCFEIILEIEPDNLMVRNNYGYYLSLRKEKLDYALKLSKLTVESEPANATYLDTYGWILFQKGETKEAKKYIEAAIRNGAYNNGEVLDHYGQIMMEMGKCKEAIEAWESIPEEEMSNGIMEKIESARIICK